MEHLRDYPECNGQKYYVSTKNTSDHALETAVFKCDENHDVVDYNALHVEHYDNEHDAVHGHIRICHDIEKYVCEPEAKPEEKNSDEETVTITSKQLQEALGEAFAKECNEFFDDDEVKGLLFAITFGSAICNRLVTKFFGKDDE